MAAKKGSGASGGKKMTKAQRRKRKQKKIAILAIEAVVVDVLIVALYFVTKLDIIHREDISDLDILTNDDI